MTKRLFAPTAGLLLCASLLLAGCGARRAGPAGTVAAYRRALERGKFDEAYGMMSSSYRTRVTQNEYIELMKASRADVEATVQQLGGAYTTSERATFHYGLGEALEMTMEHGQWRLAHDPSLLYDQSTPYAAVRSFARAYRFSKWDVLLRFVPLPYRDATNAEGLAKQFAGARKAELDALVGLLETVAVEAVQVDGVEAMLSLGTAGTVRLVRENDGRWCIRDIQ